MAKPGIPPNTIFLKWGRLQIAASGHLAISAVIALEGLAVLYFGGRALGWW